MTISPLLAVVAAHVLLTVAGLLLFLQPREPRFTRRTIRRLWTTYGVLLLLALLTLLVHLVEVQVDPLVTTWLDRDHTATLQGIEGTLVPGIHDATPSAVVLAAALMYLVVHPWMTYFLPLFLLVTDEERAARANLLSYPLLYALTLPLFLLVPVEHVYLWAGTANPLAEALPHLSDLLLQWTTSATNGFPAFHVGLAILLANATRHSRNRRLQAWAFVYAAAMVAAPLVLALHWATSVGAGVAMGLVVAGLVDRVIDVERIVKQRIKPSPSEAQAIRQAGEELVARTLETGRELGVEDVALVGSVSKGTYLRDHVDLDVFALFPPEMPRDELEARGLKLGRTVLPDGQENYAEHPYIQGRFRGYDADVVPAYGVRDPEHIRSAVDRTPFHTEYVNTYLDRDQRDDVRLLKRFMRGVNVYGAEARVRGFSGYLAELLVLKCGSFRGVLEAAHKWRPGTSLTLTPMEGDPVFDDALVFIDPVDPDRNAASAVAGSTLERFIEASRAYVHRPRLTFFFPRQLVPLPLSELRDRVTSGRGEMLLLTLPAAPGVLEDHLWDQVRKAEASVVDLLERHGFKVRASESTLEPDPMVLVEVQDLELPEGEEHPGPPMDVGEHADRFREKWTDHPDALGPVREQDGRLVVTRRRRHRYAQDLLRDRVLDVGLGKDLDRAAQRHGVSIHTGADIVEERTALFLTAYLDPRNPWQR